MNLNLTRAETAHRSQTVVADAIQVTVDLSDYRDLSQSTFPTSSTIALTAHEPETFVDFVGESVDSVQVDGVDQPVRFEDGKVCIAGLVPGEQHRVMVAGQAHYSRSGEGLHRYQDPADGRVYLYTQYEPTDSRRVYPTMDQPDIKMKYTFVITAPDDGQILSNQPEASRESAGTNAAGEECATVTFAPTPPLSSYLTCICVGPYHRWDDQWSREFADGTTLTIPLGMLCRESLAGDIDTDELFTVTKQGLDFFHDAFDYPYPWGKYDSIFVPEYNLGAMENPGLVTFTDAGYIFSSGSTRAQHAGRANTVLHEMSHMWFGDLVTPKWWDELWLKESFADFMGTHACAHATEFTDAWSTFAARRKAWAYLQDQLPTTHPIAADIPDVEAARQNFDGITYAKGASVLRQLVAFVGEGAFFAGARAYFTKHAFSATTLPDLISELEATSGRDLGEWVKLWLETAGLSTLTTELAVSGNKIERFAIHQESTDPRTGESTLRPHRLVVGLYQLEDGALVRTERFELDVEGETTDVPQAAGLPAPALVVLNDEDLTYAKVRIPDEQLPVAAKYLHTVESSLTRAGLWSSFYNALRDGLLPAREFAAIVLSQAPYETNSGLLTNALNQLRPAIERFAPATERDGLRAQALNTSWEQLHSAEPGSDAQLLWARCVATFAATNDQHADEIRALLAGETAVDGLPLGPELRWQLWTALAATGHAGVEDLDAELAADHTSLAPIRYLQAKSARPDADVKAAAWDVLLNDQTLSNNQVSALAAGFNEDGQGALRTDYVQRYFEALTEVWASRSQEMAERFVDGTFPADLDLAGGAVDQNPVIMAADAWLTANTDAPGGLRRLITEHRDEARRALEAQA